MAIGCVVGAGIANPLGSTLPSFWAGLDSTTSVFEVTEGDEHYPPFNAARVADQSIDHGYTTRYTKRVDRFVLLAMSAVREALRNARIEINDANRDRIGLIVANGTGGWAYVEPMLRRMYADDSLHAINPYVATAWFPTAAQGEISIALGIRGYSKTLSGENLSGAIALQQAHLALEARDLDIVVVVGAEAPLTPVVHMAWQDRRIVSQDGSYSAFGELADGTVLGEGAAAIVLQRADANSSAESKVWLEGLAFGNGFSESMEKSVRALDGVSIEHIYLDGRASLEADAAEYAGVSAITDSLASNFTISAPSTRYGNAIAASFLTSVVVACLSLQKQAVVSTLGRPKQPSKGTHISAGRIAKPLTGVMVNGSDGLGQAASVIVRMSKSTQHGRNEPCA
ncbi:beta-ketoacyl synthase N-terminal-like domain-containing protein [Paenarthrobacter sp. NPDC089675]|uniref:beta-ketoacyl synthase N-terminal-like domain-containing protein n=1 Tax=Paenarthrobacter sp. NPDC089675 TaxID=3364376 RepID=UPI003806B26F